MHLCRQSTRALENVTAATTHGTASSVTWAATPYAAPIDFYLTKWFSVTERVKLRLESQSFNVFNHPNFGLPRTVLARNPWKAFDANRIWRADLHDFFPDRPAGGVGFGGGSSPRMIAFQLRLEF
jgi:hypothetical protein